MTIKAYADASFKNNKAGIGIFVKCDDKNICKINYTTNKCSNAMEAELHAIYRILMFLVKNQQRNKIQSNIRILVFSDCKGIVSSICRKKVSQKYINNNIFESCRLYKSILSTNNMFNLIWIPRKANKVADKLSKKY